MASGSDIAGTQQVVLGKKRQDSMEMNDKIYKGMGEFVEFLYSLDRIKQKIPPDSVFYTRLLEDVDPTLAKWKAKTEVK